MTLLQCPRCSATRRMGDRYCHRCGELFDGHSDTGPAPVVRSTLPTHRLLNRLIPIGGILLAIGAIAVVAGVSALISTGTTSSSNAADRSSPSVDSSDSGWFGGRDSNEETSDPDQEPATSTTDGADERPPATPVRSGGKTYWCSYAAVDEIDDLDEKIETARRPLAGMRHALETIADKYPGNTLPPGTYERYERLRKRFNWRVDQANAATRRYNAGLEDLCSTSR